MSPDRVDKLPEHVRAEVHRILQRAARRLLQEQLDAESKNEGLPCRNPPKTDSAS